MLLRQLKAIQNTTNYVTSQRREEHRMCCIGEECARALKCNHLKVEIVRKRANKECSTTVEPEDWTKTTKSIETKFCSMHTRDALTMRNLFDLDSIFTWRTAFPWKWPKLIELIRQCFPSMAHPSYRKCESTYLQMLSLSGEWRKNAPETSVQTI